MGAEDSKQLRRLREQARLHLPHAVWMGLGFLIGIGCFLKAEPPLDSMKAGEWPDRSQFLRGRFVYERHCVVCHGHFGRGDGELTPGMLPKPRDLTKGIFKFRSTPSGFLPRTDDLLRTIRQGLSGSAMPSFSALPDRDLEAVVEYVKSFSLRWRRPENYAPAVSIPEEPPWITESEAPSHRIKAGRDVYLVACAGCHGKDGRGRLASFSTREEGIGETVPVPDLTQAVVRSGLNRQAIYRTLVTGIDGTPMPSFLDTLTAEQCWELVAFLESIKKDASAVTRPGS